MKKRRTVQRAFSKAGTVNFGYAFLAIVVVLFIIYSFATSLFFNRRDRINILLHSAGRLTYYSISTTDDVNYLVYFRPDLKVTVPGGYKFYRFGALARLSKLDKKPDILKKAFSSATSSFVDYYFYPQEPQVLYGQSVPENVIYPSFGELFLSESNASFLDRAYLYLRFISSGKTQFNIIPSPKVEEAFAKSYQGFFYKKTYRNEKRLVQIIYTKKYTTADLISRILEGNGIRVVDLTYEDKSHNTCIVRESRGTNSKTAGDLAFFFGCRLEKGETGTFDIIFILGDKEAYWEA